MEPLVGLLWWVVVLEGQLELLQPLMGQTMVEWWLVQWWMVERQMVGRSVDLLESLADRRLRQYRLELAHYSLVQPELFVFEKRKKIKQFDFDWFSLT